jgi:hypothetical protein
MLRFTIILLGCLLALFPDLALSQPSGVFGISADRLQTLFQAQIRLALNDSARVYEKSLVWFESPQFLSATHQLKVRDSLQYIITQELEPALNVNCLNPEISEWFDIQQSCDRIQAKRKTGMESKTRLESQILQLNANCDKIVFIETLLSRNNWLYQERIRLRVYFSPNGKYAYHLTEIMTDVPLSGAFVCMVSTGAIRAK